jgi:signal transduction histidine kinase/class 3 adenylate cyclase
MKKRLLFISMPIIAVLVLLAVYLHGIVLLYSFPDMQDGFADVTEIGSDRYRGAILTGDWIGQWGVLTPPEEAATGALVPLRGGWRELSGTLFYEKAVGMATYALTLKTRNMIGVSAFYLPPVSGAYTLYINGTIVARSGVPGMRRPGDMRGRIVPFNQTDNDLEIRLHISNYQNLNGGIWKRDFEYGTLKGILYRNQLLKFWDILQIAILLSIGFINILHYTYQRRKEYLLFGHLSFVFGLRVFFTGQMLFGDIFSKIPWTIFSKIDFVLISVALLLFLLMMRRRGILIPPRGFLHTARIFIALSVIGAVFLPDSLVTFVPPAAAGIIVVITLWYIIWALLRHTRTGLLKAVPLLFVFSLLGVNDLLFNSGYIATANLLIFGGLLYGFYISFGHFQSTKLSYKELEGVYAKLKRTNSLKDEFLADTSHELRTPLHGIIGLADALVKGSLGPLNSDQIATVSLIASSGMRLSNLVNDILDFSKIRENRIILRKTSVDLWQIIEGVLAISRPLVLGKYLVLSNNLPRCTFAVYGDEGRIEQIIHALIGNSIRFTEEGEVSVSATEEGDFVEIIIRDTGAKIGSNALETLFKAYDTGDSSLIEGFAGSGLSLAIARRLIELHGGTIELHTFEDGGSAFQFTLPKAAMEEESSERREIDFQTDALQNLQPLLEGKLSDRDIEILIVDDDVVNLQIMKSQLASMNYSVIPAVNGQDALERIEVKLPNLVLLDIVMPKMSGYEVCRKIREKYSSAELPVILMTPKNQISDMMEGLIAGANDFLTRPYQQEEFLTRVNTHLQLSRVNAMYSHFVPIEFLQYLGHDNIVDLKLGDQIQREMTVLFVDIRSFTNLSENMTPQENFKFINSYLSRISPIILRNNGFVDKYIGDSIMALYPEKPEDAINTAIEMIEHLTLYNQHRKNSGYPPINIGVGIHTGMLILGIIGVQHRMQGTVISDAVNLASRIQDVTKLYGANILISQDTFVRLDNPTDYDFRFLGKVRVKGKEHSVSLFEVFDSDPEEIRIAKDETKSDFERGILLFSKRDFKEAESVFNGVVERNNQDRPALLFWDRSKKYLDSGEVKKPVDS